MKFTQYFWSWSVLGIELQYFLSFTYFLSLRNMLQVEDLGLKIYIYYISQSHTYVIQEQYNQIYGSFCSSWSIFSPKHYMECPSAPLTDVIWSDTSPRKFCSIELASCWAKLIQTCQADASSWKCGSSTPGKEIQVHSSGSKFGNVQIEHCHHWSCYALAY